MKTYTKEEKKEYFSTLRARWNETKKLLTEKRITDIEAIIREHGLNISVSGYCFVSMQMEAQRLGGLPYVDAKTFLGWRSAGFQVRKGEKSTLSGITWIRANEEKEIENQDQSGFMFPKEYHLFHRSQVDEIV